MYKLTTFTLFILYSCTSPKPEAVNQTAQTEAASDPIVQVEQSTKTSQKQEAKVVQDASFVPVRCSYKQKTSTLGMGIVSITGRKFAIYNDATLSDLFWQNDVYNIYNHNQKCCGKFHKPDYGILSFVCVAKADNHYQIIVNDSTIKYMGRDTLVSFQSWEDYIDGGLGLRRSLQGSANVNEINPIRLQPNEQSDIIAFDQQHENLCFREMKGDWIKVSVNCFYGPDNYDFVGSCSELIDHCEKPLTGWIKWREGEKLLIDVFLLA